MYKILAKQSVEMECGMEYRKIVSQCVVGRSNNGGNSPWNLEKSGNLMLV